MHVNIASAYPPFLHTVSDHLQSAGHTATAVLPADLGIFSRLRLPVDTPVAAATDLLTTLSPLPLALSFEPGRTDALLELVSPPVPDVLRLIVYGRNVALCEAVAGQLRALGLQPIVRRIERSVGPTMQFRQVPIQLCGLVAWAARLEGWQIVREAIPTSGRPTLLVHLPDSLPDVFLPTVAPILDHVTIHTEARQRIPDLTAVLELGGCAEKIDCGDIATHDRRFQVTPLLDVQPDAREQAARVHVEVARWLERLSLNAAAMPLMPAPDWDVRDWRHRSAVRVTLPLFAWRSGKLVPWGEVGQARYRITVLSIDPAFAQQVTDLLCAEGFVAEPSSDWTTKWLPLPHATRLVADELLHDPHSLQRLDAVLGCVVDLMRDDRGGVDRKREAHGEEKATLWLVRPSDALRQAQDFARKCRIVLRAQDGEDTQRVRTDLEAWLDCPVEVQAGRTEDQCLIQFGGAPQEFVDLVSGRMVDLTDDAFCVFGDLPADDMTVFIGLPAPEEERRVDVDPFVGWGQTLEFKGNLVELRGDDIRLGHVWLPKATGPRHPLAPDHSWLEAMCLDVQTSRLLVDLAAAVDAGEPCLLEGPTSSTKTSGILLLAALLDQPVLRLNLSSQTDTSELVGYYVPTPGGGFHWQDGAAVRAVTNGWWLVLDELNLAPPQVVERLNSLLERPATLTLSEHDHRALRPHPSFRLFATMNPGDYAGRSSLSPAGKDRWLRQIQVSAPDAAAIEAMLRQALFGERPVVLPGVTAEPTCLIAGDPRLLLAFVRRLARLHAHVLGATTLGQDRRDGYVFTRRGLLALLDRAQREVKRGLPLVKALQAALRQAYVDRVAPEDREALGLLMDAEGLGPRVWSLGGAE